MSEVAQGLLMQAMDLPEADRRWLGERLLDAEDADEFPYGPHHDPEFMAELIRRSDLTAHCTFMETRCVAITTGVLQFRS